MNVNSVLEAADLIHARKHAIEWIESMTDDAEEYDLVSFKFDLLTRDGNGRSFEDSSMLRELGIIAMRVVIAECERRLEEMDVRL